MPEFLVAWAWAATSLSLGAALMAGIFRANDADLGLAGLRRETAVAAIASLLQAIAYTALLELGLGRRLPLLAAFGAAYGVYRFTHRDEMDDWEVGLLMTGQGVVFVAELLILGAMFKN